MVKKNTSYNIISQVAAGDYAHATKSQTKENAKNHTINENGLTLKSSIIGNYDDISPAKLLGQGRGKNMQLFAYFYFTRKSWIYR